jgi:NAD(P)-dependent dehydrogenase (short-subunit alcohol dehydrogenase family)
LAEQRAHRRLAGDVAVVTGAGRGIGRTVSLRLAAEGAAVAALDLSGPAAERVAAEIEAAGGSAVGIEADVSSRPSVKAAVAEVQRRLGAPSVLVNNAGIARTSPFLDTTDEDWGQHLAVNLTGPFIVSQEVGRALVDRGGGRVVNISSISAHRAQGHQVAYASTKAGLEALTRAMAFDLGPLGVNVNAIAPGLIMTELNIEMLSDADRQARLDRIPVARTGAPEDIAAAVAFLVSPEASFINGAVLLADGGFHIAGVRPQAATAADIDRSDS